MGSFITDGSYRELPSGVRPKQYQKIRAKSGQHSCIVISDNTTENVRIETKDHGSPVYQNDLSNEFKSTSLYTVYERNSVC